MSEVRRCANCGAVEAVCVREWKHTTMGLASGSVTRDFCCQKCGRQFSLVPMREVWVWTVMSVLLFWTCVFPFLGGPVALIKYLPYMRNPVVPNAPYPEIRYRMTEPIRRCAKCGGKAHCSAVTQTRSRGFSTGTTYNYSCGTCSATFTTASVGGHIFNAFGAIFCFLLGFGCMPAGLILWVMSLGLLVISGFQILAEMRNPLIAEAVNPSA